MSSNKKRRELNRAAEEYDRAKVCSQLAAGNHSMLNIVESVLGQEVEKLRAENESLKQQVEQGKRDAVPEDIRKDADRLDWINGAFFQTHWNGVLGSGNRIYWRIAGDYRHTAAKMIGNTFREAIDAAIAAAPKQEK